MGNAHPGNMASVMELVNGQGAVAVHNLTGKDLWVVLHGEAMAMESMSTDEKVEAKASVNSLGVGSLEGSISMETATVSKPKKMKNQIFCMRKEGNSDGAEWGGHCSVFACIGEKGAVVYLTVCTIIVDPETSGARIGQVLQKDIQVKNGTEVRLDKHGNIDFKTKMSGDVAWMSLGQCIPTHEILDMRDL